MLKRLSVAAAMAMAVALLTLPTSPAYAASKRIGPDDYVYWHTVDHPRCITMSGSPPVSEPGKVVDNLIAHYDNNRRVVTKITVTGYLLRWDGSRWEWGFPQYKEWAPTTSWRGGYGKSYIYPYDQQLEVGRDNNPRPYKVAGVYTFYKDSKRVAGPVTELSKYSVNCQY